MSLLLTDHYKYNAKNSAFAENWFMMLYYDAGSSYLGIAEKDIIIDSNQFYGLVKDWGEVIESIDIANSKSAVSEVEILCSNIFKNKTLAEELYGGSKKYLNRKVKIYTHSADTSTLANAVQVYEGFLKNIVYPSDNEIGLVVEGYDPAYGIKVPTAKASIKNSLNPTITSDIFIPLAYGDFDPDTAANFYSAGFYYPMPFAIKLDNIYFLPAQSYGSPVSASVAFYDSNLDKFLPLTNGGTVTVSLGSTNLFGVDKPVTRTAYIRPTAEKTGDDFTYTERAYDQDSDGSSNETTYSYKSEQGSITRNWLVEEIENPIGKGIALTLYVKARAGLDSGGGGAPNPDLARLESTLFGESDSIVSHDTDDGVPGSTLVDYWSHDYSVEYAANDYKIDDEIPLDAVFVNVDDLDGYIYIYDVYLKVDLALDYANEAEAAETFVKEFKTAYCSRDGLSQSYTDNDGGIADLPHEIHRDLLKRFTDFDYDNDYMKGFSATNQYLTDDLNSARSGWTCHWWQLEPRNLQEILEQIQYEGCFIMLPVFDSDASGNAGAQYIWVHDTYAAGDVTHTLDADDYDDLKLGLTDLSEIITKYSLNYQRHPANNSYRKSETFTNASRTDYFPDATNENIVEGNLDFITAAKVTSGATANASFAKYYDNISGSPKIIGECRIKNMLKSNLRSGDIIKFSDTVRLPYGKAWADLYFIVTETRRQPGSFNIKFRLVYEA